MGMFEVLNVHTGRYYHSKISGDGLLDGNPGRLTWVITEISQDMQKIRAEQAQQAAAGGAPPPRAA